MLSEEISHETEKPHRKALIGDLKRFLAQKIINKEMKPTELVREYDIKYKTLMDNVQKVKKGQ